MSEQANNVTYARGLIRPEFPWQDNENTLIKRPSPQLSRRQAQALRAVQVGMEASGVTDNDGRPVTNVNTALRALLDRLADEIEAARDKIKTKPEPSKKAASKPTAKKAPATKRRKAPRKSPPKRAKR